MICPYCGNRIPERSRVCPECGQQLLPVRNAQEDASEPRRRAARIAILCASWAISLVVAGFFIYKVYFWIDAYQIDRLYLRGSRKPSVTATTLKDGRPAHVLTFFADSGDQIFLPELGTSYPIAGGFTRIEIPDSTWFSGDLTNIDSAIVTLSPMLIRENGDMTRLPHLTLDIPAPASPLTVLNPEKDGVEVHSAIFPLKVQVVPGSRLFVNGNEVTGIVDRSGQLTYNLNVYPVGDNTITVLVRTPNHKETRRDVVIYRPVMEIELEISLSTTTESPTSTMTVSGKVELGARIVVDSAYVENSLVVDGETGNFKFMAKFNSIGENTVAFRAVKEGKKDSIIRFTVNYLPDEDEYTRMAWGMNYDELRKLFEQWKGRPFKCIGPVIDVFQEGDLQYFVMDTGTEGFQQLVVLINRSERKDITPGPSFSAYADVEGRYLYNGVYYPLLNARYVYKRES